MFALLYSRVSLGCMIVELLDYRPQRNKEPTPEKPDRTRVVLHPNSETLWSDICSLNSKRGDKLSDLDAIDIESKIIVRLSVLVFASVPTL